MQLFLFDGYSRFLLPLTMRFSQRIGKTLIKELLQVESIDEELTNRLWNLLLEQFFDKLHNNHDYGESDRDIVCKLIWKEFFKQRIDLIPSNNYHAVSSAGVIKYIEDWYFSEAEWFEIFDFIEFLAGMNLPINNKFVSAINKALKQEVSAYRLLENQIVQITSEEEIQSIEEALSGSNTFKSVNLHLQTSLDLLSDRQSPDYRNSIKESISAVEALCKIIVGDEKASFANAIAIIENKYSLHASLKEAYKKIYGYTSDADGIRHAMLEDGVAIEFEDAKFMLVSCSAFINYLKAKLKL